MGQECHGWRSRTIDIAIEAELEDSEPELQKLVLQATMQMVWCMLVGVSKRLELRCEQHKDN